MQLYTIYFYALPLLAYYLYYICTVYSICTLYLSYFHTFKQICYAYTIWVIAALYMHYIFEKIQY